MWVIILNSTWEYKTLKIRVPFEVLQKKRGVSPQLYLFLGTECSELMVFDNVELERS
jgi:hypothetical protein